MQRLDGQVRGGAFAGLADLDDRNQVPGAFGAQVVAAQRLLVGADLVGVQLAVGTEQLRQKLETITGKKIDLATKIDPSVLGGIRLDIEGTELDGTVQNRLATLRRNIAAATL